MLKAFQKGAKRILETKQIINPLTVLYFRNETVNFNQPNFT